MSMTTMPITERERELGAIIDAYSQVTDKLRGSHDRLREEVQRLREELARTNAELRRRERLAALGEMAAGVAHEIRNPLAGIQLFAALLSKDLADRPAESRLVEKISKCVASLDAIVTDILDFARPSGPEPAPTAFGDLASEVIELAVSRVQQAEVEVVLTDQAAGLSLVTDGRLLQRALLNLLTNAIAASTAGAARPARVEVSAERMADGWVVISVRDSGSGVPEELKDRIFNPFFTTKADGVGLGLAIVHQIAETLGGVVRVANHPEGGAVFTLRLPAVPVSQGCETHVDQGLADRT